MTKFWLVWCYGGGAPVVPHQTNARACEEAERLARENPGKEFVVLEAIAQCSKSDVTWETADDVEMPF